MLWLAVGDYRGPRTVSSFVRYVVARFKQERKDAAYRIYLTDCLRNISASAADVSKMAGGEGRYMATRFADILYPKPEETRTGAEIIEDLRQKLAVN